ncbi:MAG: hypothetical protein O3B09_03900, partial [Proteobacteria bacterium]|nr:hypothetical protein [Pseudomonadota bacterium]
MARKKNFLVARLNIRYIRYQIYKLLAKSSYLRNLLNLYEDVIHFNDIDGKEINIIKFEGRTIGAAKEMRNVAILGKTSTAIDLNSQKVISGHDEKKVVSNFFKPTLSSNAIEIRDSYCINFVGIHKGYKNIFHFFLDYFIPVFYFLKEFSDKKQSITIITRKDLPKVHRESFSFLKKAFPNITFLEISPNQKVICHKFYYLYHDHFFFYDRDRNPQIVKIFADFRELFLSNHGIVKP